MGPVAVPDLEVEAYEPGMEGDIEALAAAAAEAAVVEAAERLVEAAARLGFDHRHGLIRA